MLFKNIQAFKINQFNYSQEEIEAALSKQVFAPCSASQAQSIGWVAPRGIEHASLYEYQNGNYVLCLLIEEKKVPTDIVNRRVKELCDNIERETGRKPGHRYKLELKEDATLELLPNAFPRQKTINILINLKRNLILVDSSSQTTTGLAITTLVKTFEGLAVNDVQTKISPSAAMMDWLLDDAPTAWTLGMKCQLITDGDKKSLVRYSGLPLDTPEIRAYIEQGMMPSQASLTYMNHVSFDLTHDLKLKKLKLHDIVFETSDDDGDPFDTQLAIEAGIFLPMLDALFEALGGVYGGVQGRLVKIRGYGNAIVPQVAAEVIKVGMECLEGAQ